MKTNVEIGLNKQTNNFKTNLKYFRGQEGLTQNQLANSTGLTQKAIGAYEEGRATPTPDTLINIADFFGIRVDELIRNRSAKKSIREFNPAN